VNAEDVSDLPVLARGESWTLYREPTLMLVRFHGLIDDAASAAWRAEAQKSFDADGFPRFAFVAPTGGHATTSLSSRMRTVQFLQYTAKHTESVTIVSDHASSFVIRTILRAAGAANVRLIDIADAKRTLTALRATARAT
jgi:hypothetical protein